MYLKRLLVSATVMTICVGASLSIGLGPAGANVFLQRIAAVGDEVASIVTRSHGSSASLVKSRFVLQATKTTPVTDEAGLLRLRDEWVHFTPRTPRQGEVTQPIRRLPTTYEKAGQILCNAAAELVDLPDEFSWQSVIEKTNESLLVTVPEVDCT